MDSNLCGYVESRRLNASGKVSIRTQQSGDRPQYDWVPEQGKPFYRWRIGASTPTVGGDRRRDFRLGLRVGYNVF
jgi:hypothetical protein